MLKSVFSIIVGALLAVSTLLLVGIYWTTGLLARVGSILLFPLHFLLGKSNNH